MGNRGPRASLPSTKTVPCRRRKIGSCSSWPTSKPTPSRWCTGAYSVWSRASQSVDSRPFARTAGGAARPRRCPRPLPRGPGPAPRGLRGRRGDRGRPAGGGAHPCGSHPSRRAGLPPFAHDGTERRIVRPQDPAEQQESYSGKKRDHTVKNILLVNALLLILFLIDTHCGRVHDLRIAEATPYPLPAGSGLLQDLGFLSFTLPQVA